MRFRSIVDWCFSKLFTVPVLVGACAVVVGLSIVHMVQAATVATHVFNPFLTSAGFGVLTLLIGIIMATFFFAGLSPRFRRLTGARFRSGMDVFLLSGPVFVAVMIGSCSAGQTWPIDTAFSPVMQKQYVLGYGATPTDVTYRILSTDHLWHPIWDVEFTTELDYSEDGSLIDNPGLILSADGEILVIERGGEKTDALQLVAHVQMARFVPWTSRNWGPRTAAIETILAHHESRPTATPLRSTLDESVTHRSVEAWCEILEDALREHVEPRGGTVTCVIDKESSDYWRTRTKPPRIPVNIWVRYEVDGIKAGHLLLMELIEDAGALYVVSLPGPGVTTAQNGRDVTATTRPFHRHLLNSLADPGYYIPLADE